MEWGKARENYVGWTRFEDTGVNTPFQYICIYIHVYRCAHEWVTCVCS